MLHGTYGNKVGKGYICERSLILDYDFSDLKSYERNGSTVFDRSQSGFNGTLSSPAPTFSAYNKGIFIFSSSGSKEFITIPGLTFSSAYSGNFTICAWVFRTLNITGGGVLPRSVIMGWGNGGTPPYNQYVFYFYGSNLEFTYFNGSNSFLTAGSVPLLRWSMVSVVVRTSGLISMYIDTKRFDLQGTANPILTRATFDRTLLGTDPNTESTHSFNRMIGRVTVYNRDLTDDEIYQNYRADKNRFIVKNQTL
jgi:hypothetical protein